ncbi:MAG: hypothetical protein LBD67_01885, partial [Candidatus Accumulibacter sp.]|nr:hypothetical protein [Accumulibacter sp.]
MTTLTEIAIDKSGVGLDRRTGKTTTIEDVLLQTGNTIGQTVLQSLMMGGGSVAISRAVSSASPKPVASAEQSAWDQRFSPLPVSKLSVAPEIIAIKKIRDEVLSDMGITPTPSQDVSTAAISSDMTEVSPPAPSQDVSTAAISSDMNAVNQPSQSGNLPEQGGILPTEAAEDVVSPEGVQPVVQNAVVPDEPGVSSGPSSQVVEDDMRVDALLRALEDKNLAEEERDAVVSEVSGHVAALSATPYRTGGALVVSGPSAKSIIKTIAPEARLVAGPAGSVVVGKRSAPEVAEAINNARAIQARMTAAIPGAAAVSGIQQDVSTAAISPDMTAVNLPASSQDVSIPARPAGQSVVASPPRKRGAPRRKDLIGDIISTGGLSPRIALDVTGDTAAKSRLPGLFRHGATEDLSEVSRQLNTQYAYSLSEDGRDLAELIRRASGGERILSPEQAEIEADEAREAAYKDAVKREATRLNQRFGNSIRTRGVKFNEIVRQIEAVHEKRRKALEEKMASREAAYSVRYTAALEEMRAILDDAEFERFIEDVLVPIPMDNPTAFYRKGLKAIRAKINDVINARLSEAAREDKEAFDERYERNHGQDRQDGQSGKAQSASGEYRDTGYGRSEAPLGTVRGRDAHEGSQEKSTAERVGRSTTQKNNSVVKDSLTTDKDSQPVRTWPKAEAEYALRPTEEKPLEKKGKNSLTVQKKPVRELKPLPDEALSGFLNGAPVAEIPDDAAP